MMTKEEVLSILKTHPNGNIEESQFKKKFPELYQEILSWFFPDEFKWTQRLYHFLNDDPDLKLGLCPMCGKRCGFHRFGKGYSHHCSKLCKSLDPKVQRKTEETCLKRYGKNRYAQTDEYKERCKQICLERYGIEHPQQLDEIKNKSNETNIQRYGDITFSKTQEWKKRVIETSRKLFGKDFYMQTDEYRERYKQTCLEKYGVEYYSQTDESKEKYKESMLEKYGVTNFSYTDEFRKNRNKKIDYDNLTFDSSWEVDVYKYCKDNNINCEYQPLITFEYEYDGKIHHYHPDFLINGKIYEVKGNHFFEGDKMICPYDRTIDDFFEAKNQCMKDNNVIILTKYEIENLNLFIKKDVH